MVVDDAESMRTIIADLLTAIGVGRVLVAESGAGALDQLAEADGRVDLIICDIEMPGMNGFEFIRRVRYGMVPACKDVPILILTGTKLEERDVLAAFAAGATDYLTKPIKTTLVRSRVSGWLLRARPA